MMSGMERAKEVARATFGDNANTHPAHDNLILAVLDALAAEREACAQIAEDHLLDAPSDMDSDGEEYNSPIPGDIADLIRARGKAPR